jgi:hypothetical protein
MKKGKNAKLSGYRSYKVNYGTVDSKNLKSIYLNIQTWVKPKKEIESPIKSVNNLTRQIKNTILENINTKFFNDNFIVDLDLRSSGIQYGKKSFLNLECYFYLKEENLDFKSLTVKNEIKNISDTIIKSSFKKNETFSFSMTKKEQ